jgi:hypothetical protein
MGWKDRRLSADVIELASKIGDFKQLRGAKALAVSKAAVKVAGFVEAIAREEGIGKPEAVELLDEEYSEEGLYFSVIRRCVEHDA